MNTENKTVPGFGSVAVWAGLAAAVLPLACGSDVPLFAGTGGAGGGVGASGGQPATGSGGAGGATTSTGGSGVCPPGEQQSCYSGPRGTEGVGDCHEGVSTCAMDGSGFGPCEGEVTPGADDCMTLADEDCDGIPAPCPTGDHLFSTNYDHAFVRGLSGGAQGRIAVTGRLEGPQNFGAGPVAYQANADVFALVYDVNHALVFAKGFGTQSYEEAHAIAIDASGGVAIVGRFSGSIDFGAGPLNGGDSFILRLGASGNVLWSRQINASVQSHAVAVALDAAGAVYVTGDVEGGVDLGGGTLPPEGGADVFVLKLDTNGNHVWSKRYGDSAAQEGMGIAVDVSGNVLVSGSFQGGIGFGGPTLTNTGEVDGFLVKLDASGNHGWTKHFGGLGQQRARAVAVSAAGEVAVAGYQQGSVDYGGGALAESGLGDIFVARYDSGGNHLWSDVFGDNDFQQAWAVAVDGSGNTLVAGDYYGVVSFGGPPLGAAGEIDAFLAKLSPGGAHVWSKRFGDADWSSSLQLGRALAVDDAGRVVAGGEFHNTISIDGNVFMGSGSNNHDGYVARFAP